MSSVDLKTTWLGLQLKNPLVVASSSLTDGVEKLKVLEKAGAAAVVLPTLFEEEIEHDEVEFMHLIEYGSDSTGEASNFLPDLDDYHVGPGDYLKQIAAAKEALSIPVVASINAVYQDDWVTNARHVESAGADALELNVQLLSADLNVTSQHLEDECVQSVAAVCESVKLPVAVKLGSRLTAPANLASRLVAAGASGLTLFNRPIHPEFDLEELHVISESTLSGPGERGKALRWIGILRKKLETSFAASCGIHDAESVVKLILAGADCTQMASALIQNGPEYLTKVLAGVEEWLIEHEDDSIEQVKGSLSQACCEEPEVYKRSLHMRSLIHYTNEDL